MSAPDGSPPPPPPPPPPPSPPPPVPPGDPGHSDIFDRLSKDKDKPTGLIGLVAYGLYQRRKRKWITDFCSENGRHPTVEERRAYSFSYRQDSIEALLSDAENVMGAFAQQTIDDRAGELQADALAAETHEVLGDIYRRLIEIGGYWHHIVGHLVGFAVLAGLVFAVTLIVRYEPSLDRIQHQEPKDIISVLVVIGLLIVGALVVKFVWNKYWSSPK